MQRTIPSFSVIVLSVLFAIVGCESRKRRGEVSLPPPPVPVDVVLPGISEGSELEPGTLRAFGLVMPVGTVERLVTPSSKIFYVQAPMPKVMRYLQRRLEITHADIRPLGAMIRNARVKTAPGGTPVIVDVGVRDEGDRTLVTVWNRTVVPAPPRSMAEGLRAAGFDPRTGRPLPENNH